MRNNHSKWIILKSFSELKQKGFLANYDYAQIITALESSETLLSELKSLHHAFGVEENYEAQARHINEILVKYYRRL